MTHRNADPDLDIEMYVHSVDEPTTRSWDPDDDGDPTRIDAQDQMLLPRQGTGTWPNGERAVRIGSAEEILITLPTNPFVALGVAARTDLVSRPIRRLMIDASSVKVGAAEISWDARLRTAPWRTRQASLRMYASPSLNVTVITLVPTRASKFIQRSFVRHGLRTTREFGRRIEEMAPANVTVECQI